MHYIWNNYSDSNCFHLDTESIVPGIEVWNHDTKDILVNVLPRLFDMVFPAGFIKDEKSYQELIDNYKNDAKYQVIFNYLMHLQATLDLNIGFHIQDIVAMCIENKLMNCEFGKDIKENYINATVEDRYTVLCFYAKYLLSGCRSNSFEKFIEVRYGAVNVYYQESTAKTYLYIHTEENEYNLNLIELAKFFLCDFKREIQVMWKGKHLPFIGYDYSMIMGEMYLG